MSGELGKIPDGELNDIFKQQELWLETNGKESMPANLSGRSMTFTRELRKRNMTGADCNGTDFSHANLAGTIFNAADLCGATFNAQTILTLTNFIDAQMDKTTDFTGADLTRAVVDAKDFGKVNLLTVERKKLPKTLQALRDGQEKKDKPDWVVDFKKSGRSKGRLRGLGGDRFNL